MIRMVNVALRTEDKIALAKLKMAQEEHEMKMKMLQAGLEGTEDNDIKITITRATKED